ncbi:hypothetical protein [Flavobacterium sp.]|uniref:hypothetical protein n=1 Tax=Flavobacterium sp. TaxID=239 RepID=UPI002B4B3DB3|nr:hypothetical protein [Flavobacterium sp.]HLF52320.1 hypothetical protein [Flavobacterium sp.]
MKKVILMTGFVLSAIAVNAQTKEEVVVVQIPSKGIALECQSAEITKEGATLTGVKEIPYTKQQAVSHNVPGILTNINHIGEYYYIQCTAGPGYCFTWYAK